MLSLKKFAKTFNIGYSNDYIKILKNDLKLSEYEKNGKMIIFEDNYFGINSRKNKLVLIKENKIYFNYRIDSFKFSDGSYVFQSKKFFNKLYNFFKLKEGIDIFVKFNIFKINDESKKQAIIENCAMVENCNDLYLDERNTIYKSVKEHGLKQVYCFDSNIVVNYYFWNEKGLK